MTLTWILLIHLSDINYISDILIY